MTIIDGKTVADCFAVVARYGTELNALCDALENLLSEQLTAAKTLPCVLIGNAEGDDRYDDSEWVATDQACSLPLKSIGKRKVGGYIGFQISMTGDGINISGNEEPLLHVFFWESPINFDDENYIGFPFESNPENPYKYVDDRLMLWGERSGNWNEHQWVYSLRLMSINTIDDLKKYVVTPTLALLKGKNVREVLPDEWLDKMLIRYSTAI
jgi:hypothetical protein